MHSEVEGRLVGFMAITSNMDPGFQTDYEIGIYEGLTIVEQKQVPFSAGNACATNGNKRHQGEEFENQIEITNAFRILMLCLEADFESRATELVAAVLKKVEKEYCFVRYPFSSPRIPLLQFFTRVPSKVSNCTAQATELGITKNMALYVLHRRSLDPGFEVRPAKSTDVIGVSGIIKIFPDNKNIIEYIEHPSKGCLTMVAVSSNQIVGFAVVEDSVPSEALFSHFDLCSIINLEYQPTIEHAILILFVVNPNFSNCRRFFLREIMRQINKSVIYCPVFPNQELLDVIDDLVLARPRQHSQMASPFLWGQVSETSAEANRLNSRTNFNYSFTPEGTCVRQEQPSLVPSCVQGIDGRNAVSHRQSLFVECTLNSLQESGDLKMHRRHSLQFNYSLSSLQEGRGLNNHPRRGQFLGFDCALYYTTHKLICRHRAIIDSRILVVGASRTSESCLHKLITCPYMHFTNLTLVSHFGLKILSSSTISCPDIRRGPANSFPKLGLDCELNVVLGYVVNLDRKSRNITLSTGQVLLYDYLVLSSGLQDQTRWLLGNGCQKGLLRLDELAMLFEDGSLESGKIVNDRQCVVVYGGTLEAFCAIQILLSKGIRGNSIYMIYSESKSLEELAISCFGDACISQLVLEEINKEEVIVKPGMKLVDIFMDKEGGVLKELKFENVLEGSSMHLSCSLLVTCDVKFMDIPLFNAIQKPLQIQSLLWKET